jgi:hypothetical protein
VGGGGRGRAWQGAGGAARPLPPRLSPRPKTPNHAAPPSPATRQPPTHTSRWQEPFATTALLLSNGPAPQPRHRAFCAHTRPFPLAKEAQAIATARPPPQPHGQTSRAPAPTAKGRRSTHAAPQRGQPQSFTGSRPQPRHAGPPCAASWRGGGAATASPRCSYSSPFLLPPPPPPPRPESQRHATACVPAGFCSTETWKSTTPTPRRAQRDPTRPQITC